MACLNGAKYSLYDSFVHLLLCFKFSTSWNAVTTNLEFQCRFTSMSHPSAFSLSLSSYPCKMQYCQKFKCRCARESLHHNGLLSQNLFWTYEPVRGFIDMRRVVVFRIYTYTHSFQLYCIYSFKRFLNSFFGSIMLLFHSSLLLLNTCTCASDIR